AGPHRPASVAAGGQGDACQLSRQDLLRPAGREEQPGLRRWDRAVSSLPAAPSGPALEQSEPPGCTDELDELDELGRMGRLGRSGLLWTRLALSRSAPRFDRETREPSPMRRPATSLAKPE